MKIIQPSVIQKINNKSNDKLKELITICYKKNYPYCNSNICNCTINKPWFKKYKDEGIPLNQTLEAINENEES